MHVHVGAVLLLFLRGAGKLWGMHSLHRWNGQAGIWKWIGWNFFSCNWLRLDPIEFWCIGNISVREIFKISTLKRIKLVDTLNCYNIEFCNSSTLFSSFPRHAKVLYLFIFRLNLHKLSSPMLGLPLSVSICARWILHWIRIKKFIRSEEHSKLNAKLVQSRVEGGGGEKLNLMSRNHEMNIMMNEC